MDDAQERSLDDIVIGAYQELFLKEIEKARSQHDIRVYHTLNDAREILGSYLAESKGAPGLPSVDQLLAELVKRRLVVVYPDEKIRTRHLELIIRAIYSRELSTLEYVILKPRESPLPSFRERKGFELYEVIKSYFKTFTDEKLAETLSTALVNAFLKSVAGKHNLGEGVLSEYQYVNLKSLFEYASNNTPSIPLLAAPTGTGKTWIFAIYALARVLEAKIRGERSGVKVIIVYPRKALARDQFERILKLIHSLNEELRQKGLDEYVISIGIWDGDSPEDFDGRAKLMEKRGSGKLREGDAQAKYIEFRGIACPVCGTKLVYNREKKVIECPRCGTIYDYVSDVKKWISEVKPDILITNPWALNHRLISSRYRDLLSSSVRSIVIDEAHALKDLEGAFISYLLARLLLRLAMHYKGVSIDSSKPLRLDPGAEYDALDWIRDYVRERSFTIILSSATISTAPSEGERRRDAESFVRDHVYPKLYEVFKSICKGEGRDPIIYHDYDQLYSSKSSPRRLRKIDATVIIAPHPARGVETITQAVASCSLFWSKEFNQKFLLFADKKEAVNRLYHFVKDIIIRDRGEIYDHVFLTRENPASHVSDYVRSSWEKYGDTLLKGGNVLTKALDDPLYWLTFIYASYFSSILADHGDLSKALAYIRENQASHFNALLERARKTCEAIFENETSYLGFHYADLSRQERQEIEEKLKRAGLLGVISTSTLELGIDIDHVSVIIQYRPPKAAENFIQRLGRAGRKPETMYIALGFLLLSNFDTLYLNESYADEALFNVRPRPLPLENSRIVKNAIYYTIIDFIAYLNHPTYYSNKLKHAGITAEKIHSLYKELTTYEKPLTSIISSLLGLDLESIRREYVLFTKYLDMLYKNLENIETTSKSIKNAISDAKTGLEKLTDLLREIIVKLLRKEYLKRYLKDSEILSLLSGISQAIESVDYCIKELNGLDLYYDTYPEYLVRNSKKLLNNMNECSTWLQNLQNIIVDLKRKISYANDTILYQEIERAVKLLESIESYLGEIVDFFKNIDFVFAPSLKKLLR